MSILEWGVYLAFYPPVPLFPDRSHLLPINILLGYPLLPGILSLESLPWPRSPQNPEVPRNVFVEALYPPRKNR